MFCLVTFKLSYLLNLFIICVYIYNCMFCLVTFKLSYLFCTFVFRDLFHEHLSELIYSLLVLLQILERTLWSPRFPNSDLYWRMLGWECIGYYCSGQNRSSCSTNTQHQHSVDIPGQPWTLYTRRSFQISSSWGALSLSPLHTLLIVSMDSHSHSISSQIGEAPWWIPPSVTVWQWFWRHL